MSSEQRGAEVPQQARRAATPGIPSRLGGHRFTDPWAAALAVLFALFTVIGWSYRQTNTAREFAGSWTAALWSALAVLGLAALFHVLLCLLFRGLDRLDARPPAGATPTLREALRRSFLPTFGPVAGVWLVWLAVHYPGNIDSDTITQRLQWEGLQKRTDHHPWFDTMVFGWFWDLGAALGNGAFGLFGYLTVQIVALAAGVALGLSYLTTLGLSGRARTVLTWVTACWPTFLMLTPQMSKDAFSAIFWLPFLVLYTEALRTRGRLLLRPLPGGSMVLICSLLILSKRTNTYLVLLCMLVLLATVAWRRWVPLVAGFAVIVGLTQGLWAGVLLPASHIAKPTSTDMLTLPIQQTARIAATHGNEIPPHEREVIDKVLRWDGLGRAYVPRRSDAAKGRWKDDASAADKRAYFEVWRDQLLRYPGTATSATAANTFEYFSPTTRVDVTNETRLDRYLPYWKSRSYPTTSQAQIRSITDQLDEPPALDGPRHGLNTAATTVSRVPILGSKAFYASWLPLLVLVAAVRRRNGFQVACCTPFLVNLGFLFAGPIALPRYLTSAVIVSTFLIGLGMTGARWQPRRVVAKPVVEPIAEPVTAAQ